jgi:hypothetical protein
MLLHSERHRPPLSHPSSPPFSLTSPRRTAVAATSTVVVVDARFQSCVGVVVRECAVCGRQREKKRGVAPAADRPRVLSKTRAQIAFFGWLSASAPPPRLPNTTNLAVQLAVDDVDVAAQDVAHAWCFWAGTVSFVRRRERHARARSGPLCV